MKRRQNDGRYPDDYAGYQNAGYDDGYDDGSGFQDDPFSETSAAANHRVKAQQAQDKRRKKKKVRIAIIVVVVLALLVGEFIVLMDHCKDGGDHLCVGILRSPVYVIRCCNSSYCPAIYD